MSATAFAILAAFAILLFLRFQLDVRWIVYGLMVLAGVAAWAFCESLEELWQRPFAPSRTVVAEHLFRFAVITKR